MKKLIAIILISITLLATLSGCGKAKSDKTTVVCTTFPIYDWAREVIGDIDGIELVLLVKDGSELHSFQPSTDEIIAIKNASLVLRVGGADDSFINNILEDSTKDLRLLEAEGIVVREMLKESHEHTEGDGHEHTRDEHIWLSIKNAEAATRAIANELSALAPDSAENLHANADAYISRLQALDNAYKSEVSKHTSPRLIFADRFPFIYMTKDYGIDFCAAFEGCTTETDASFETVVRLANKLDEWGTGVLCVTEDSDKRLAESVISASSSKNAKILVLDSMQSVGEDEIKKGITYISVMENNLFVLSEALCRK